MADTGASAMTMEELSEELTIQKVILDSLENQSYPGVEDMRQDAQTEINRLKKLLHAKKRLTPKPEPTTPVRNQAASHSVSEHRPPQDRRVMSTPSRGSSNLQELGSFSLPNRKRALDSAHLSGHRGQPKARRTTPVLFGDPFSTTPTYSNTGNNQIEIVDLTGDDDDFSNDFIAEQRKAEHRQEQEKADLAYAQQLSQGSTAGLGSASLSPNSNAFTRLMSSQPRGGSSFHAGVDWATAPGPAESDPLPQLDETSLDIPGGYDPLWNETFGPGSGSEVPADNSTAGGFGASSADWQSPRYPSFGKYAGGSFDLGNNDFIDSFASIARPAPEQPMGRPGPSSLNGARPGLPGHHNRTGRPAIPAGNIPWAGSTGLATVPSSSSMPTLPGQKSSSLGDIISKTSMFDYAGGRDLDGNALPERLTNFLQDAFHDPRVTEKDLDNLLQNIRPDMDIPEMNRDGTPAGLKRPLYPHQELAVTWMKKMEMGSNKGGILADDMGLGKTISTLALLLARPATSRPKTNLIVGPVALIRQWEEEIATKTKLSHRLSVFVYHNKKTTTDELLQHDVVLTTYGTVAQELKRLEKFMEENAGRSIDYNDRSFLVKCPLLHPIKARFYRVVLDEAQCIKNRETKTAKACTKLRATYRWCLTGTPMMNGVLELYSLLNFLRIKPYSKWDNFRQSFGILFGRNGDPKSVAMDRLRALLKAIMLRRKKNSQLDGKPILKLPEKSEEIVHVELSSEERDFYNQLEKNARVQFSKYLRAGSIGKNYSNILVLLLRMRQACCHPHLNLDVEDAYPSSISDEEKMKLVKKLDSTIVERIKAIDAFECPICYDAVQCPSFFFPCGHDSCGECLVRIADNASAANIRGGDESSQVKCPVCRGVFDPSECFSYEIFQKVYMPESIKEAEAAKSAQEECEDSDDEDSESEYISDDEVDSKGNLKGFIIDDEVSGGESSSRKAKEKKAKGKGKNKAKGKKAKGKKKATDIKPSMLKTLRKEGYKNQDAFKKYMRYLRKTWEPAAKVTECMTLLKEIHETGEKTIIFSQWTLLLDLLEVAMHHEKMAKPERYDGSMTATNRHISSQNFRDRKDVKVMLVSLRAGNAGLNLTAASRVIIMDPFWNPYTEMQAVDRAYRIGQQREVKVYRILTKDTIEDRIVALQNKKKEIVEAALDEAESVKIGRLSEKDLKFLFNAR